MSSASPLPHPKDHVAAACSYTGTTYMVLYLIAETVQAKHDFEFWGSVDNIATRGHMNRDTARKAFRQLEADGWLEAVGEKSGGRKTTRYRFVFQPADLEGVGGDANPRISSAQPADLEVQPADLVRPTRGSRPPTRGSGGANQEPKYNRENRAGMALAKPAAVLSAPDLADLARFIIAEEQPTQPMTEHRDRAIRAADEWLTTLAKAPDRAGALADVEPILRWALHHHWWARNVTTVAACASNWPRIVRQYNADATPASALSKAQTANLEAINRFTAPLIEQRQELA